MSDTERKRDCTPLRLLRMKMGQAIGRNLHVSFSPQEAVRIMSYIDAHLPKPRTYKRPAYEEKIASRLRA